MNGHGSVTGAYVHVPFCFHKCHYCDFYSVVDTRSRQQAFVDRLIEEFEVCSRYLPGPFQTVFVGGGTPTLLEARHWRRLLDAMNDDLPRQRDAEFTIEANPETVTEELAETLAAGGVNRVSIGSQSFHVNHLKTLERWHDPANVDRAVQVFRAAGIENINLDLIFAIPDQTLDDWLDDLDRAIALEPAHLSCYGLTYEPNTLMTARLAAGEFHRADEDLESNMYQATIDRLAAAGFEHYEISNWSRPGQRCRHNMMYWTNGDWWPYGPSAAGHVNGVRWKNVRRLDAYLHGRPLAPIADVEQLDAARAAGELLMLGLRLVDGIPVDEMRALIDRTDDAAGRLESIDRATAAGLLQVANGRASLTRAGLLLADEIIAELI
jgi:oxygen-independent coproporphyrinogen-3 oxidase